jgi:hypothetical protein
MTKIVCDATRKEIKNPRRDFNYFTVLGRNLSADAKFELDDAVRMKMAKKPRYSFEEFKKVYTDTLDKMCQ